MDYRSIEDTFLCPPLSEIRLPQMVSGAERGAGCEENQELGTQEVPTPESGSPCRMFGMNRLMRAEREITGHPLMAGNKVKLLKDGPQTFRAMFAAMRKARYHIHLETFIIDDGKIAGQLAKILIERRRAGVEVRMVYDAVGALDTDDGFFHRLRENSVRLHKYHPINPIEDVRIWRINNRHHRKMVIVDGRVAFIGGLNISDAYNNSSLSRHTGRNDGWRDTQVQVDGPGVKQLQELFVRIWSRLEGSPPLTGPHYFPVIRKKGNLLVRAVHSSPGDLEVRIYRLYLAAIRNARKRIWITQGYFSPDKRFLRTLLAAARRGVDVRLLLPGLTDSWITINSSRSKYDYLLSAGIRIFERKNVLQHAKTALVDGVWSTVGSANLDHRSFLHANEANLVIWGKSFGAEMETLFIDDQRQSSEVSLSRWRKRPLWRKTLEYISSWFDYWL